VVGKVQQEKRQKKCGRKNVVEKVRWKNREKKIVAEKCSRKSVAKKSQQKNRSRKIMVENVWQKNHGINMVGVYL
jgi:hypothetical protein